MCVSGAQVSSLVVIPQDSLTLVCFFSLVFIWFCFVFLRQGLHWNLRLTAWLASPESPCVYASLVLGVDAHAITFGFMWYQGSNPDLHDYVTCTLVNELSPGIKARCS